MHRFTLPADLAAGLREVARGVGATPYMTLLAAYATLLHRYTGHDDVLIGSPFACRDRVEMEGLVGYVTNPVVLRADLRGDPTFAALLGAVKETVLGALAHQDYPFPLLVERLRPSRDLSQTPLFQASFAWEQPRRFADGAAPGGAGFELDTIHVGQGGAAFDLTLQVADAGGEFTCVLQYNTDLFDDATIARRPATSPRCSGGVAAEPGRRVSQLPLLTDAERRQQAAWNDTRVCYDAPDCLHEMVAAAARRSPMAVAVSFDDQTLTYAELDAHATRWRLGCRASGWDRTASFRSCWTARPT
ncbi:Linear gramicidin synthase subunit D [Mycobacterium talmoniae]|uniref:Linear gramicidin synthase subunit D n=1 Tax=Mycobacterium talmoniae TaxID=1858794 RepID=A0A2S8BCL2_9MYCO|nr:Linear gramicidin synthase subunit D [Mycobacterium talmoniae]